MKNNTITQTVILVCILAFSSTVFGQLSGWDGDPYTGSVPAILNSGTQQQTKVGSSAVIGIRTGSDTGESDTEWLNGGLVSGSSVPALFTDSSIAIYRHSISGINTAWAPDTATFALDTNVPIASNGVYSKNTIMSIEPIETAVLGYSNFVSPQNGQVTMCSSDESGSLEECESQEKPEITISVNPTSIPANSSEKVTISWSTLNSDECHAINGPGFFADKQLQGEDISNGINLPSSSVVEFTLGCTNQMGTVAFKSAQVSVQ